MTYSQPGRPHPGARIEAGYFAQATNTRLSPPPGGADRSIPCRQVPRPHRSVAPTRGRGSKLVYDASVNDNTKVAPTRGRGSKRSCHAHRRQPKTSPPPGGADRSRPDRRCGWSSRGVAPTRGRGSKRWQNPWQGETSEVAPTRGRGSKLRPWLFGRRFAGRPHPGARIEARNQPVDRPAITVVAPTRGRGSKQVANGPAHVFLSRRPHPGARIEASP